MTATKQKLNSHEISASQRQMNRKAVRFVQSEPDPLQEAIHNFSGERLAEVIHNMATEHFRKVGKTKSQYDKKAEEEIKALFDKHTDDVVAFQAFLERKLS